MHSTLIYTSELILCSTICVYSATRHNIHICNCIIVNHKIFSDSYWLKLITWLDSVHPQRDTGEL